MVVPDQGVMCVIESNTLWIMEYSITCVLRQIRLWALHQLWIVASITTESIHGIAFAWTFNLVAFLTEWNLNFTSEYQTLQQQIIDLTAIQMVSDHPTMPNWESNWSNLISRGIGCKVFNHLASQARSGWVDGWGHFAKVSDQNCQKSQEQLLVVASRGDKWCTHTF